MSKELYVTSTPHETKLAVVEDDQLVEVFFERENEYTLAGSIYKGKVTRVLPGMQSAFVDIGLERDAFLYVTDFLEEVEDDESEPAKPASLENSQERSERPERGDRDRGGRDRDRRRHRRGGERDFQQPQRAEVPLPEGSFVIDHDATEVLDEATESSAEMSAAGAMEPGNAAEPSGQQDARGPRRWRGRRGRRRRGGMSESRFARPEGTEQNTAEPSAMTDLADEGEPPVEPTAAVAEPGAQENASMEPQPVAEDAVPEGRRERPRREERQREERPREERPRTPSILLPGESLAKYGRKVEEAGSAASSPQRSANVPRPSTEYTGPTGLAGAGLLAGESLAKYRNRPQAEAPRPEPVREPRREEAVPAVTAVPQQIEDELVSTPLEVRDAEPAREAAAAPAEEVTESKREYGFQPGAGVIEEEEIEEEEHEFAPFSESLEEGELEELEEETLEHREDDVIAASEGLAEAFARSRAEDQSDLYMAEEDDSEDDEELAGAEGEAEEAELYAEGEEPSDEAGEQLDPDDPNYSGRAETRAGAGTAGFQQRTERRGFDRARRERGRRGGRPVRRGGPRRNIPRGPMPQIGELLQEGQEILVQIAKEPMAKKGARITSHIALPGRFLVFMPTVNHTGVSRKIGSDEERQRLKRILLSEKGQSSGGFIVRTAAAGASEDDLRADIRFLINLWGEIKQRAESSKAPALIYHDLNLVERILRDQVTSNFSQIWVDTEPEYERILRFASRFQPSLVKRVKLYTKDTPLFEQFNITEEINKALKSKVWLKSGGYIVINQTEALVAIDINTGKYVGKTGRLEDTIVKTNLDAIKEIVRQIRLRDLGGIIIIDFIDMDERKNRQKVMQALEAELKHDRSPSKVLQFNDFGLVAITRKRVKQSLERTLSTPCSYCTGTGMTKSVTTVCNEIYVEMRKMSRHLEGSQVMLRVHPEVGKALKENQGRWLVEMEELTGKSIIVKSDPAQHQEQFDIH